MKIELDEDLIRACREYNADTPKLTTIGKLNKVAFIGERICALIKMTDKKTEEG